MIHAIILHYHYRGIEQRVLVKSSQLMLFLVWIIVWYRDWRLIYPVLLIFILMFDFFFF